MDDHEPLDPIAAATDPSQRVPAATGEGKQKPPSRAQKRGWGEGILRQPSILLLLLAILLTACASTAATSSNSIPNTAQPTLLGATVAATATTAPTIAVVIEPTTMTVVDTPTTTTGALPSSTATDTGPAVTQMMADLGITGERYAAQGDPNAPITVVEFSDYG